LAPLIRRGKWGEEFFKFLIKTALPSPKGSEERKFEKSFCQGGSIPAAFSLIGRGKETALIFGQTANSSSVVKCEKKF